MANQVRLISLFDRPEMPGENVSVLTGGGSTPETATASLSRTRRRETISLGLRRRRKSLSGARGDDMDTLTGAQRRKEAEEAAIYGSNFIPTRVSLIESQLNKGELLPKGLVAYMELMVRYGWVSDGAWEAANLDGRQPTFSKKAKNGKQVWYVRHYIGETDKTHDLHLITVYARFCAECKANRKANANRIA